MFTLFTFISSAVPVIACIEIFKPQSSLTALPHKYKHRASTKRHGLMSFTTQFHIQIRKSANL